MGTWEISNRVYVLMVPGYKFGIVVVLTLVSLRLCLKIIDGQGSWYLDSFTSNWDLSITGDVRNLCVEAVMGIAFAMKCFTNTVCV